MANPAPGVPVINAPNAAPPVSPAPAAPAAPPAVPHVDAHPLTTVPPVDPHTVAPTVHQEVVHRVSEYLGFSPWWLLAAIAILAAFSFYAYSRPEQFEAGAGKQRGVILGLRSGALYSGAFLGLISLIYTHGFYWIFSLAVVLVTAGLTGVLKFHKEVEWRKIGGGLLTGLGIVTAIDSLWVIGFGTGIYSVIFGLLGGVIVGGYLMAGRLMDFFQSIGSQPKQNFTSDSASYGIVTAFSVVTVLSILFGDLSSGTTIIVSLLSGGAAGFLTTKGKYLAHETPAAPVEQHEETEVSNG